MMPLKELVQLLHEALAPHLEPLGFKEQGPVRERRWRREASPGVWQIIHTVCSKTRMGGGTMTCSVAVRFDDIEEQLNQLTAESNCYRASPKATTVGESLEGATPIDWPPRNLPVNPLNGLANPPRFYYLSDAASVARIVDQLMPRLHAVGIPWLDKMKDPAAAYRDWCARLARYKVCYTIEVARACLLAQKIGVTLPERAVWHLRRLIAEKEFGADVCQRILEMNSLTAEASLPAS